MGRPAPAGSAIWRELFRSALASTSCTSYRARAGVQDLLAGQVQMVVLDVSVLLPHIPSGTSRLGGNQQDRSALLPDVPATAEIGLPTVALGPIGTGLPRRPRFPSLFLTASMQQPVAVLNTREAAEPMMVQAPSSGR